MAKLTYKDYKKVASIIQFESIDKSEIRFRLVRELAFLSNYYLVHFDGLTEINKEKNHEIQFLIEILTNEETVRIIDKYDKIDEIKDEFLKKVLSLYFSPDKECKMIGMDLYLLNKK